jgi:hypothetical protein
MEANIIFENVKAYDVIKWDVKLGETFKVELVNTPGIVRWFSDNDPVLAFSVEEGGTTSSVKATEKGTCEIQLQYEGSVIKTLQIEVYDNIAIALNPSAKAPTLK